MEASPWYQSVTGLTTTSAGRMMIGVLGSLAEYERELIKERSALKRQMSRSNGTKFGVHGRLATRTTSPPPSG